MGRSRYGYNKTSLMLAAGANGLLGAGHAPPQARKFSIPAQPAVTGIPQFGKQADLQILAPQAVVKGKRVNAVQGAYSVPDGLSRLLQGGDLVVVSTDGRTAVGGEKAGVRRAWTAPVELPQEPAPTPAPAADEQSS